MSIIRTVNLEKNFGGLKALSNLNLSINKGSITSIIGPNGAGKTTLFNCITGFNKPNGGDIFLGNLKITGQPPHLIARSGIARTFQNIRLLSDMTVLQNIMVSRHINLKYGFFDCIFRNKHFFLQEDISTQKAMKFLDFMGISEYCHHLATSLPYGIQKRVEIARALSLEPEVILLDEPSAGMIHAETMSLMSQIQKIRDIGKTVVLIEHDMNLVMSISDWVIVLNYGVMIAEGTPNEIKNNRQVIETYLGFAHEHLA
ncbi:MAG: ABC transporter ATP-binding protein [Thermodesulfovibrionales bacterium]|nr:ABC transporter ATP-binding protein [Thermodesulfovibrionales bacterium]